MERHLILIPMAMGKQVMLVSKYTTQVRFICENKSGLLESVGSDKVDEVIANSWDKVITTKCEMFDESYRQVLFSKVLKHYYLREIGAETVGIWQMWMNTKFEEVMPYYNQLYKSALLEFNPFYDVDVTRSHDGSGSSTGSTVGNVDTKVVGSVNVNGSTTGKNYNLFSDTPQGALTGVESETYLTDARKITDEGTRHDMTTSNSTSGSDSKTDTTGSSTEKWVETVKGKQGSANYSSLLKQFRETMLNIDLMVIGEFEDLFMQLW